ncbi:restriction endonuclease [Nocardia takedensis]|uniref:restriction endonuclease n=1 Tax=Nocardia takedensis TaxID=259390 RepID=UPI003F76FF1E
MNIVNSPQDAERLAAGIMIGLGYQGVSLTTAGADGGIDVRSNTAIAQVKLHSKPTGRPDLQKLCGARALNHDLEMLFFSAMGYSAAAIEYADETGMALFVYDLTGTYRPANRVATIVLASRSQGPAMGVHPGYAPPPAPQYYAAHPVPPPYRPQPRPTKNSGWMILLYLCFWPVFLVVWWVSPSLRPHWVQKIVDFAHRHPKACAWSGVAFGLIGGIGNVREDLGATAFGLAIAAGCGFLLLRWRRRERAEAAAAVAARADVQHNAYLAGDDFGVYGTRDTPSL